MLKARFSWQGIGASGQRFRAAGWGGGARRKRYTSTNAAGAPAATDCGGGFGRQWPPHADRARSRLGGGGCMVCGRACLLMKGCWGTQSTVFHQFEVTPPNLAKFLSKGGERREFRGWLGAQLVRECSGAFCGRQPSGGGPPPLGVQATENGARRPSGPAKNNRKAATYLALKAS